MLFRSVLSEIDSFYRNNRQALLVSGARQVGKTYLIREWGKSSYKNFIELNFLENRDAKKAFRDARSAKEILMRLSAFVDLPAPGSDTLIFLDEIQEAPDAITAIKFLVEDGSYRYILSGSLLGEDLQNIRSVPVGYMGTLEMYPLTSYEFMVANGINERVLSYIKECYENEIEVDDVIHKKLLELYNLYLIVGGMPEAVSAYIDTNNLRKVEQVQKQIINLYKMDIAKYDKANKLYIEDVFNLIPSELNSKNKRFILKNVNENLKFSRYENSFIWLRDAGVAIPVFIADEPKMPLVLSKKKNLFKLFSSDVGLLASMYSSGIQKKILEGDVEINSGAIWENAVAEELNAAGFKLYYFNSKKLGEVDFLIEKDGKVLPIEVKSGRDVKFHKALDNIMAVDEFAIEESIVISKENMKREGRILYLPVYMLGLLKNKELDDLYYHFDASALLDKLK